MAPGSAPAQAAGSNLTSSLAGQAANSPTNRLLKQSGADEGIFTVQIRNPGSAELTVNLEATDPEKSCQYTFDPPQVAVPAGQERPAQLKIRPKALLRGKEAKIHPFTVTARPAAAPRLTQQVQGEWEQLPRRRSTWLKLAVAHYKKGDRDTTNKILKETLTFAPENEKVKAFLKLSEKE